MKKSLPVILLFFSISNAFSQKFTQEQRDSIAFVDSVIAEVDELLGLYSYSDGMSYADFSIGLGNGFFYAEEVAGKQYEGPGYYSIAGGYYHKSGFNVTAQGSFISQNSRFTLFQTSLSPGYNYTKSKKIGFGIAYYHYFIKDSLSFYTSPLVNEFFGYVKYKGGWLVPKLSIDYGFGKEVTHPRPNFPNLTITNKVTDFSLVASVDHSFRFLKIFDNDDGLSFTPSISLVAGTSNYGTNLSFGNNVKNTERFNRIMQNYNQNETSHFKFQSINLSVDSEYDFGKFYLQPQLLVNYVLPASQSRFNFLYNLAAGISF